MKIDIAQLEFIEPLLREIALDVEKHFKVEFTITSLYRIGDSGVHGQLPLRAVDLRCLDNDFGRLIEEYVNLKYQYDPSRQRMAVCMYHDTGRGRHIHLQVHPRTIKR